MKKYNLNGHKTELEETTIIVESDGIVLHPDRLTIDVNIVYQRVEGSNDMDTILEVPVKNMNFDGNLEARVLKRLEDFEE